MSENRIVFVVRKFWPGWNGSSRMIGLLAAALVERGWQATVVMPQSHVQWPRLFPWRGVAVVRLPMDRSSRRGEAGYLRHLGRWFRERRDDFDMAYVAGLRHDACAVLEAVKGSMPVVLCGESAGREGDCLWHLAARGGRKLKKQTQKASAWVGPSQAIYREMVAAGYDRDRTFLIPHGIASRAARDETTRTSARRALAADRPILMLDEQTPLAVYAGRIDRGQGLLFLLTVWEKVLAEQPKARLWLAGHGPDSALVQEHIDARELGHRVTLVGQFEQIEPVLDAADLFVLPGTGENVSVAALEAMAAALPIVAVDHYGNREIVEDEQQGLLVPSGDAGAMAGAIVRLFDDRAAAAGLGIAARRRVECDFSLAKMVESHVVLFEQLRS